MEFWKMIQSSFRQVIESSNSHSWIVFKENSGSLKDSFGKIMALVVLFNLELHQMDVKTTLLNGDIDETVYMVQPENFVSGDSKNTVFKLTKTIYGLKQASCQWYHKSH